MKTSPKSRPPPYGVAKGVVKYNESSSETTATQFSSLSDFDNFDHIVGGCQDWSDFIKDGLLRKEVSGSNCQLYKVKVAQREGDNFEENNSCCDEEGSFFLGYARYTLKCLRRSLSAERMKLEAQGLLIETKVLFNMAHPNIVRLRGRSAAFSDPEKCNYFVLYDPLQNTLEDMLKTWRKHPVLSQTKAPIFLWRRSDESWRKIKSSLHRRIQLVSFGVVQAMSFIHSRGVALRNLKPTTIGFDSHGVVKLYDFSQASPPGSFQKKKIADAEQSIWTQPTQELLAADPGFEMDVYAFGLILWLVASLKEEPKYSNPVSCQSTHQNKGSYSTGLALNFIGKSPSQPDVPSKRVRNIISACWESDPCFRPTFSRLKMMLVDCYGTIKSTAQPSKRRLSSRTKKGRSSYSSSPTGLVKAISSLHS